MKNFTFQYPVKIVFGEDAELKVGEEAAAFGKKALIHHDSGPYLEASGLLPRVKKSLEDAGVEVLELGGVRPNPVLSLMREGIDLVREEGVDVIIALGGGSVIDSAKTIAVGAKYDGDVWDFALWKAQVAESVPLIAINTMSGTGSETSICAMVVNDEGEKEIKNAIISMHVLPEVALVNPALQYTLPANQTASGAFDIISHTIGGWFSNTPGVDLSDRIREANINSVIKYAPIALQQPSNYEAREQIAAAAIIAVTVMATGTRDGGDPCHGLENPLTTMHGLAHGTGLAIMYPAWMKKVYQKNLPRFVQFANRMMDVEIDPNNLEATAKEGIVRFENYIKHRLNLPTRMKDIGIHDKTDIEALADLVTDNGNKKVFTGSYELDREDVLEIYRMAQE